MHFNNIIKILNKTIEHCEEQTWPWHHHLVIKPDDLWGYYNTMSGRDGTTHYITYFCTQQEISRPVLNFWNFSRNFKLGNSGFIFGTKTEWELASPEWWDWDRTGKRMFPKARHGKFPGFFWEKSGSREMAFGSANLYSEQNEKHCSKVCI